MFFAKYRLRKKMEKAKKKDEIRAMLPSQRQRGNAIHYAQARKIKQFLELGNTKEAEKRAEYFDELGISAKTIKDCETIMEAC